VPFVSSEGSWIHAILLSEINTDLPGPCFCGNGFKLKAIQWLKLEEKEDEKYIFALLIVPGAIFFSMNNSDTACIEACAMIVYKSSNKWRPSKNQDRGLRSNRTAKSLYSKPVLRSDFRASYDF